MNAIVELLVSSIREGRYPANRRLPSERALACQYKVPLSVARAALKALCDRGLAYRVERGGTFVNLERRLHALDAPDQPVHCINFIEPLRSRKDLFGFALADYLNGYTRWLQNHPLRIRFVTFDPSSDRDFEGLLYPALPAKQQACVIGDLLSADMMRWLDSREVPFVVRRHSAYDATAFPPHHGVFLNRHAALYEAVRHLMDLGHARIGFVGQILDPPELEAKLQEWSPSVEGYRAAFYLAGRFPPSDCEAHADGKTSEDVRRAAETMLRMPDRPTALVCQNDFTALLVMETAQRFGLRVPGDLSVTGFDNDPAGLKTKPPLTTFRGHEALAVAAIERLFAMLDGTVCAKAATPVGCEMIVRDSTAAPAVQRHAEANA